MVSERRAFGERLKRHRERRGITLQAISETTKVPAALFAGLERGDCSRWPAGLYSRAYMKAYAEVVGLNTAEAVEEFAAAYAPPPGSPGSEGTGLTSEPRPPAGHLRLSMAPESAMEPERLVRRGALAAADLVLGFLIASVAYAGLGANVWITIGCALSYHAAGRVVSDDPLLYWLFQRARQASTHRAGEHDVPVGDTASTTA